MNNFPSFLHRLSLAVLMLVPTCCHAQYHWFCYRCTENISYWKNDVFYETSDNNWVIRYDERETHSIGEKVYIKAYCEPESLPTGARGTSRTTGLGSDEPRDYTLGIRKADGKVYVNYAEYLDHLSKVGFCESVTGFRGNPGYIPYHLTDDGEMILYDYTMEVGDQYRHVEGFDDILVASKDYIVLEDGKERRRLTLSNGMVIVEDLGCINSTGLMFDYLNPADDNSWLNAVLQCVIRDDNYLYKNGTSPEVDKIDKVDYPKALQVQAYNLHGRLAIHPIQSNWSDRRMPKGVYIQNGRKVIR